jgi:hypothetical protein
METGRGMALASGIASRLPFLPKAAHGRACRAARCARGPPPAPRAPRSLEKASKKAEAVR